MSKAWKSLDAIASRVQEKASGGVHTNIDRVKLALVRDEIHKARAKRLQELARQKKFNIARQYYQKICCLKVICEKIICNGEESGDSRMIVEIPSLIGELDRRAIRFIGTLDGIINFEFRTSEGEDHSAFFPLLERVHEDIPYAILENNMRLILYNSPTPNLEYICVELITDNPEHPLILDECEEMPDYPIPGDELAVIEHYAYTEVVKIIQMTPDLAAGYGTNSSILWPS